jgi:Flp pilus assembly protein TadD
MPEGNAAWNAGRYAEARAAYDRVLVTDPLNVRANLRVGILLSWAGQLDSAITLVQRARRSDPTDNDLQVIEARIHAWHGQYDLALAQYDSVLHRDPAERDAALGRAVTLSWADRFREADAAYRTLLARNPADTAALTGRAQLAAWSGDNAAARQRYREVLAQDPTNADALTGLAQLDHWEGHDRRALAEVDSALAVAPGHPQARKLRRQVLGAVEPQVEFSLVWGLDSDRNETFSESAAISRVLSDALRGFASVGLFQANDPTTSATRTSGEAGATYVHDRWHATAALGLRRLAPDGLGTRTEASVRSGIGVRVARRVSLGIGYSWAPFDETAGLIAKGLDVGALDASFDAHAGDRLDLSLGGGLAWLSDGNARRSLVGAATVELPSHFFVGGLGRTLDYDRAGNGYFAPTPFTTFEGRAGWGRDAGAWAVRVSGGLGVQRISGGDGQSEWHAELRAARRWGTANEVALFGSATNSAAASTTGAYRYGTAGVSVRLGV